MGLYDDMYIVGSAWTPIDEDVAGQLDELTFDACSRALRNAGVRRHQIGLSVTSSLDLYDGRSISNALTIPAAAGYLNDELRVEGDAGAAFLVAAAALASGAAEYVLVTALHVPEVDSVAERDIRGIDEHVSSYTFDAHLDRPVGMTALTTLGLHASQRLDTGTISFETMAERTAADITRGAGGPGRRPAATTAQVLSSPTLMAPLTELMLPAASAGVGAIVLASGAAGRRCPHPQARVSGWGKATAPATSNPAWLSEPYAAAHTARRQAYARAGIQSPSEQISLLEMTDLSPALSNELQQALDLSGLAEEQVNPSGGARSSHPGIAAGLLRIIEAADSLATTSEDGMAVVHSSDDLCGLVSSTTTVLVLEAAR